MFSLIRWAFSLVIFAICIWFATMVPLGSRTLWQHLRAIAGTQEAKELADGTKAEAEKVAKKLMHPPDMAQGGNARTPGKPLEDPSDADRKKLDELAQPRPAKKK